MTDAEVAEAANSEELGYFVMYYTEGLEIQNPELRELHTAARTAMLRYQEALDLITAANEPDSEESEY